MEFFGEGLRNYVNFSGRSTREDFWMYVLFYAIFLLITRVLDWMIGTYDEEVGIGLFGSIYQLALFLPSLALTIRRIHDTNNSGWFVLVPLYNLYLMFVPTYPEENDWGPVPTSITESTQDDGNKKNTSDLETKLEEVQNLLEKGLLTEEEAIIRRKKIISD